MILAAVLVGTGVSLAQEAGAGVSSVRAPSGTAASSPEELRLAKRVALTEQQSIDEQRRALSAAASERTTKADSMCSPAPAKTYAFYNSNKGGIRVRWGTQSWGYRHMRDKHGYNPTLMLRTINYGGIFHREGSANVYNRIVQNTPQYQILHKVVYENQMWSDGGTKDVITAHYWKKWKCSSRC